MMIMNKLKQAVNAKMAEIHALMQQQLGIDVRLRVFYDVENADELPSRLSPSDPITATAFLLSGRPLWRVLPLGQTAPHANEDGSHDCVFNAQYLRAYPRTFVRRVVPHEMCHVAAHLLYGAEHDRDPHGPAFMRVGQQLGIELTRDEDVDTWVD